MTIAPLLLFVVYVTFRPGAGSDPLSYEKVELRANGEPQTVDLFLVHDVGYGQAEVLIGFRRPDDHEGQITLDLHSDDVASVRMRGRYGPALHDNFDGYFLADTSRGGVESSGVRLDVVVDASREGTTFSVVLPRDDPHHGGSDEGVYLNVINEWGDRVAFEQTQLTFEGVGSGRTVLWESLDLPPGKYIARAFCTIHGSVAGFTRKELVVE